MCESKRGRLMVNMIPKSIEAISKDPHTHCQLGTIEIFDKKKEISTTFQRALVGNNEMK